MGARPRAHTPLHPGAWSLTRPRGVLRRRRDPARHRGRRHQVVSRRAGRLVRRSLSRRRLRRRSRRLGGVVVDVEDAAELASLRDARYQAPLIRALGLREGTDETDYIRTVTTALRGSDRAPWPA